MKKYSSQIILLLFVAGLITVKYYYKDPNANVKPYVIITKAASGYLDNEYYYRYMNAAGRMESFYDKKEYSVGDTIK
jgi:hypothetical protein